MNSSETARDAKSGQETLAKEALLERRLKLLTSITRLGHDAFKRPNFTSTVSHILNATRRLIPYDRACLVDCRFGSPKVVGVMGHPDITQHSEYSVYIRKMISGLSGITEATLITEDLLERKGSATALKTFLEKNGDFDLFVVPLKHPDEHVKDLFYWIVEFKQAITNDQADNTAEERIHILTLLGADYAEALWYHSEKRRSGIAAHIPTGWRLRRLFTPGKVLFACFIAFALSLVFVQVPQKTVAYFEFVPQEEQRVYAPFSGAVGEVLGTPGENVKKGQVILKYDMEEMLFDLAQARKHLAEILAELDLVKTQSFDKVEYRGQIKILELRKQQELNKIKKYEWFVSKSTVEATAAGTLVIDDPNVLRGRRVEAGGLLFKIISKNKIEAEIDLNEKDAVALGGEMRIVLYPFIQPEKGIETAIISVSPIPLVSENNQFCYKIDLNPLLGPRHRFLCGMRGVAHIYGKKVRLGYYLFRSLVVWWRRV